jgi:peptidyl-prolyl cis-trans isomerase D
MLKSMRESFHHLKWILLAVVAAFVIGFVYVDMGLGGAQQKSSDDRSYAARVNGETITYTDFNRALYFAEENYRRTYGQQFTPDMAEAMGLNRQVLNSLVDQRLLLQQARRLHLTATPAEVRRRILTIPVLNPDGKFVGAELYTRYVGQLGFATAADFEDEISRDITLQKIESTIASSVVISSKAAQAELLRSSENANIRYVLYPAANEAAAVTVTPADVEAYYRNNQAKYAHGEQRELKYLVADLARIRSQIVPTEQEVRARYGASKEDYKTGGSAHIFHILIKVNPAAAPQEGAAARAKAESLVKQLRAGADFAKLAKENSQDPSSAGNGGDMGFVESGATVEPFDQAAFSIPLKTISDPIRSKEYGYHIIKVVERRPAGYKPFEEVGGQIAAQLASQKAQDQAREEITRIAATIKAKKPATAAAFAAFANDRVSSNDTQWFQKGDNIPGLGVNQQLMAWVFTAKEGDITDQPIGTSRGPAIPYLVGIRPAGITALAEIRQRVENDAKIAKALEIARQKLTSAMAGAPNIDAVASKVGLVPQDAVVTRERGIRNIPGDTSALVQAAMAGKVGGVSGPVVAGDGVVAFQVNEQKKLEPAALASQVGPFLEQLHQREFINLRSALLERLRKEATVEINKKVLEQAHGNTPAQS